ncbi:MAG: TonB-dependent receptor plug domain-containing protein [Bacteroidetes bacterium]|nr:TonB-dependent receptor plug domain-containing protein [Bacteroidota bacterium]
MKRFLGTAILFWITFFATAQNMSGVVINKNDLPLKGATITISTKGYKEKQLTGEKGEFNFHGLKINSTYKILVEYIGMNNFDTAIQLQDRVALNIVMKESDTYLEPLEVSSVRAGDKAPFTKTNITKKAIAQVNLGQDLPFVLNQTPSVITTTDAGNGVGYTGIRIRGTDATRINVTLNGIPFNDAESMGTYFVDMPDFISSANSIQIQRGVGTSTNGSGAFGATINISTNEVNKKAYAESDNSFGSFNTWRNTIKFGTGFLANHFTFDARLSRISSDGYIDRATSNLKSFYASLAYLNNKNSLRLNIFSGKEKTYQAWYGIPYDSLISNRTYNPAGTEKPGTPYNNQTDNYTQTHYQLFFDHTFNSKWKLNTAFFLIRGKGYYEEYKAEENLGDYGLSDTVNADIVRRRWLDNYFYGQIASLQYKSLNDEVTLGGSWSSYDGKHYGTLIWSAAKIPSDYQYYNFPATKNDENFYIKWMHGFNTNWNSFVDIQYRHVMHDMNGFEDHPELFIKRKFDFFNPKVGISYNKDGGNIYFSYALAHKEPNRDDFEAGLQQQPKAETLHDFEAGFERKRKNNHISATLYYMLYKDQLVLNGQINDVGSYTRINVPNSYRAGLELQAGALVNNWFLMSGNVSVSSNKINTFTEYLDEYDADFNYVGQKAVQHHHTDISFSPNFIAAGTFTFIPVKNLQLNLVSKYVGRQYLDNAENRDRMLNGYFTEDVRLNYSLYDKLIFKQVDFIVGVNNIFNKLYCPNAYTYPYIYDGIVTVENGYYPAAVINFMVGLNISF